ncbi:MAG: serine/threonine-protein kinase [Bryobacteraceae bacterium]|nr:serine/threonine-protein kinase [Bryobacteraceae bacterium]
MSPHGSELTGRRIGSWRVEERIGRGASGEVYRAARVEGGYNQTVAVKVLRTGVSPAELENERQQLEALSGSSYFPQLYSSGTLDDGRQYLVMEFVRGEPLDRHADEFALDTPARIRLFLQLCRAIEQMHGAGISHFDLKPAHVLVTEHGGVKVIDFGLARKLRPEGAEDIAGAGDPVTLEFTSPEQVTPGAPLTMASDVYSLGAILYLLLTHRTPLQLAERPAGERIRAIQEAAPVKASDAVMLPAPERVIRLRPASPSVLRSQIRGGLDLILSVALHKDMARRYRTVPNLREDLERFLDNKRPLAKSDGFAYRAVQVTRSQPAWAAAVGLVLLSFYAKAVVEVFGSGMRERAAVSWSELHVPVQETARRWKADLRPVAASNPDFLQELRRLDHLLANVESLSPPSMGKE